MFGAAAAVVVDNSINVDAKIINSSNVGMHVGKSFKNDRVYFHKKITIRFQVESSFDFFILFL